MARNTHPTDDSTTNYRSLLQSICCKRGLPTNGLLRDLKDRIFALFGKIMRKCFYGILFCKYAKDGIHRALTMHAMLKRLPIQELRAKIYDEAKVIHAKQSKEDMIEALWGAMPVLMFPVFLTPEQIRLSKLRFLQQGPTGHYLYQPRKWEADDHHVHRDGIVGAVTTATPDGEALPHNSPSLSHN